LANLPLNKFCWAIFLAIAALALAVRLPRLGERPMHTDEAINAYITGQILAGEKYHYDPQDRHGPALYALAWPLARFAGAKTFADLTETSVRLGPVIVGALTVFFFIAFANRMGVIAAGAAALLFAIAPLPVYYSRYFIHETLFVLATFGLLFFGFQTIETRSLRNGILSGVCAGLMLACKETAVLHFAAFGIAGAWLIFSLRAEKAGQSFAKAAWGAVAGFVVVVVALYTWGGTHPGGLTDLLRSVPRMISRAGGQGHEKPAWYYLAVLGTGWSGLSVLMLALWGTISAMRGGAACRILQAVVIYGMVIGVLYCAIPYKTPWLTLNLFLPLALLAGHGFGRLWEIAQSAGGRIGFGIVAVVLAAALGRDTRREVFLFPADERNPYAYAHTVEDLLRLPARVEQIVSQRHLGNGLSIAVVAKDPWPLPWYLRKFPNTGFWQPNQNPNAADVYITSPEAADALSDRLKDWQPEFFGLRPDVLILLWQQPEAGGRHE
jgi:uncharacterized protein (TIGR03663 family)